MLRYLNILAVLALLGSAIYAYSTKYATILTSEQIVKTRHAVAREKRAIVTLRSEWAYLTRPERIQTLSDKHLELHQLTIAQIVRPGDLPDREERRDTIGRKLELLGLAEPTSTPRDRKMAVRHGSTPSADSR